MFNSICLSVWVPLFLLSSFFVILQAVLFHAVLLSSVHVKLFIGMFFVLLFFANLQSIDWRLGKMKLPGILSIFLLYNFCVIIWFSTPVEGLSQTSTAFLYNYSILIFLPFLYVLDYAEIPKKHLKFARSAFIAYVVISDIYGISQFIFNSYLLPNAAVAMLGGNDYVKFDQIAGRVRAFSFLKSPIQFGLLNVFSSLYFLATWFGTTRRRLSFFLLFSLSAIAVLSTISRTAIAMWFFGTIFVSVIYLWPVVCRLCVLMCARNRAFWAIAGVFLLSSIVLFRSMVSEVPFLNLHNLAIRLENWSEIFGSFEKLSDIIIGVGRVQNGLYGMYHSMVIDNMYIGQMLTGGLVGMVLFLTFAMLALQGAMERAAKCPPASHPYLYAAVGFFVSFLVGGLGENLMNLSFIPFLVLLQAMTILTGSEDRRQG